MATSLRNQDTERSLHIPSNYFFSRPRPQKPDSKCSKPSFTISFIRENRFNPLTSHHWQPCVSKFCNIKNDDFVKFIAEQLKNVTLNYHDAYSATNYYFANCLHKKENDAQAGGFTSKSSYVMRLGCTSLLSAPLY